MMSQELPAYLEHYEIVRELGRGGMGVVFLARQKSLDRAVALKVLNTEHEDAAALITRFKREAMTLVRLKHPNLVQLYDSRMDGLHPYIVMELVEGDETLKDHIQSGTYGHESVLLLALQLVSAVAYLHEQSIVHRDLKPGNVLIDPQGNARLVDLGVVRNMDPNTTRATMDGQILGTFAYMPPEMLQGEPADETSDVYALGLILFELIDRQLVFGGQPPVITPADRVRHALPPLSRRWPEAPAALDRLVARCAARRKADRPGNAGEVLVELSKIVDVSLGKGFGQTEAITLQIASYSRPQAVPKDQARPDSPRRSEPALKSSRRMPLPAGVQPAVEPGVAAWRRVPMAILGVMAIALLLALRWHDSRTRPRAGPPERPPEPAVDATRAAASAMLAAWREHEGLINISGFDKFRRKNHRLARERPTEVTVLVDQLLAEGSALAPVARFLSLAHTFMRAPNSEPVDRLDVRSALVDLERLRAWCDANDVPWPKRLEYATFDGSDTAVVYPTMDDVARAWTWSQINASEGIYPLGLQGTDRYRFSAQVPGELRSRPALFWIAAVDLRPRYAVEVQVNGYRFLIRNRDRRYDQDLLSRVPVQRVIDHVDGKRVDTGAQLLPMCWRPEAQGRRTYVGRWLPAGVLRDGADRVMIQVHDLGEGPSEPGTKLAVFNKNLSIVPLATGPER